MILKPKIVTTEPKKIVDSDEAIDPGDLEVVWDKQWASDHPSNRTPTQRPGPIIVYERYRDEAPTLLELEDEDEAEVPTIEIAPDIVLPLVKAMVVG